LKFDFYAKRFGEDLTGDPNAPAGVLGPPMPPPLLVSKLESSVKTGPLDDDSFGLNRFFIKFPPSSKPVGGTPF
jgi:hypothetical protein